MQSEFCRQEESKSKCSFNGSCVNHRQPLSKFAISTYGAMVPHYHRWEFFERFVRRTICVQRINKNDLNRTILGATAIKNVGDKARADSPNERNKYLAKAR